MLLTFKKEFVPKILSGKKIHTIRKGHRWKTGMRAHLWCGNPRNVSVNPYPFLCAPYVWVVNIEVYSSLRSFRVACRSNDGIHYKDFSDVVADTDVFGIATNDGFDSVDAFWSWFPEYFEGQLILFSLPDKIGHLVEPPPFGASNKLSRNQFAGHISETLILHLYYPLPF